VTFYGQLKTVVVGLPIITPPSIKLLECMPLLALVLALVDAYRLNDVHVYPVTVARSKYFGLILPVYFRLPFSQHIILQLLAY